MYEKYSYDVAAQAQRVETITGVMVSKTVTYAGGTTNDPGDFDGTGNPQNLFTISGQVLLAIIAVCSTSLTGASATLAIGKSGATARYIPSQTAANITVGKTVDITGIVAAGTAPNTTPNQVAFDGEVVQGLVGTADITGGVITYYAFYKALSAGASVTAL